MLLGIGALAAVTGIGSTLAANISLNGGGNVEFGQGVATTAACDGEVDLTPVSTFVNTAEDPTFSMTAIEISNIELTPEGWDTVENDFLTNFDPSDRSWAEGFEENAGKYWNGTGYSNTCEGKVLLLRAYTDQTIYDNYTVDGSTESPLYLNGTNGVGAPALGTRNPGVALQIFYTGVGSFLSEDYVATRYVTDVNGVGDAVSVSIDPDFSISSILVNLDSSENYPPSDSRWIDKLTIESSATVPSGWNSGV